MIKTGVSCVVGIALLTAATEAPPTDFEKYKQEVSRAKKRRSAGEVGVERLNERTVTEEDHTSIREFKEFTSRRTQRLDSLVMMDNTIGKIYPGALLWVDPVVDGRLHEVERIDDRPAVRATVSGPILTTSDCRHKGTFSDFLGQCSPVIGSIESTPVRMKSNFRVSTALEDALLDIGMSAKYWTVKVDSSFHRSQSTRRTFAVLALDQVYYSITTDAPPLGGYLPEDIVRSHPELARFLARGVEENGEIAYVRRVDYGRRLIIVLSSEATEQQLLQALKVTVSAIKFGGEVQINDETKKTWNSVEGQLILIGGKYPDGVATLFSGSPEGFVQTVRAVMAKENVIYSREEGAVPVSFELAYVSDAAPMQVYETAEFSGKIPLRSWGRSTQRFQITTTGNDARVIRQDAEIHSDDWTLVQIVSQELSLSADRNVVDFKLVWRAIEAEEDQTVKAKTIIESIVTIQKPLPRPAKHIISPTQIGPREEWYAGEVQRPVPFPDHGLLSNIRVQFDGPGGKDDQLQHLEADLEFEVWLEE